MQFIPSAREDCKEKKCQNQNYRISRISKNIFSHYQPHSTTESFFLDKKTPCKKPTTRNTDPAESPEYFVERLKGVEGN
jgi:hypothetical protein